MFISQSYIFTQVFNKIAKNICCVSAAFLSM